MWAEVVGGLVGDGCGVVDSGGSLYLGGMGTRLARTVELDTSNIRLVVFTVTSFGTICNETMKYLVKYHA